MKCIKQQLKNLPRRRRLSSLPQPISQRGERRLNGRAEGGNALPEVGERGPHAEDGGVDVDELGAEADEVGVVAIDEINKVGIEGGEVRTEVGSEGVEGDEGAEVGDVRLRGEIGLEEGGFLEPERVGVDGVSEEVSLGARMKVGWGFLQICRH